MAVSPYKNSDDNKEKKTDDESQYSFKGEIVEATKNRLGDFEADLVLQNLVLQIPHIGGPLYAVLSYMAHRVGQQRLIQSAAILHEEVKLIDETKVDKAFISTEEFFDILRIAVENCLKTRHRERIRINCKILVGAINIDKIQDRHYAEDFLNFIENLTPTDIKVGQKIYELQKDKPDHFGKGTPYEYEPDYVEASGVKKLREMCGLNEVEYHVAIHKLVAAGLIRQSGVGQMGDMSGLVIITPIFQKLVNFTQLRVNEPVFGYRIPNP